ncbi:mitochondrial 37S ribosomal protein bS18m RSM18 [Sporobolomyces salmoneus]|uniref:mitochondrial 37S ribosomal protein bS18m RSM18 n=1 Tax=Sporobolomyces salmoneus TaxID=183962 RepID=UPI00316EC40A
MFSRARALVNTLPRATAVPSCSTCRTFTSSQISLRSNSPPPPSDAGAMKTSAEAQEALLQIMEDVTTNTPEVGPDQSSILQHLRPGQIISPQHLSPQHLLTPYLPRPNFSLAHPLGPPVSFGPTHDPFVRYGLDPLKQGVLNPFWKAEFCTTMGKIKPRGKTGLQRKSQRRVGKSIRRARSMGLIPTFGISVPGQGGERY